MRALAVNSRFVRARFLLALLLAGAAAAPAAAEEGGDLAARVEAVLKAVPLVDGHNDVPWQVRDRAKLDLAALGLEKDTRKLEPPMHTDLARLRKGRLGGQFWSVYVPADMGADEAVRATLEQIDVVHRMCERWPDVFELALTAADVVRIHAAGKIASLVGMEGGHSIGNSLGALRMMYAAGARYMTITHWKTIDWADAATDAPRHDGLSDFGREVVREMNRLGMLIDLSHVSAATMRDALEVSEAPVVFSHSGAFALNPHPRNVPDDVLALVKKKKGVVMVDFLPAYVSKEIWEHWAASDAEEARLKVLHVGDPKAYEAALKAWKDAHPAPKATLAQVADHVEHVRKVCGVDCVGIGSDFDGMGDAPIGLEDVSAYPNLLVELARRGWSDEDLRKLAGENVLRVLRDAEAAAARLRKSRPPSVKQLAN